MADLTVRKIRAAAKKVFASKRITYATSAPSMVRGLRNWSRGVVVEAWGSQACVVSHYDCRADRERDVERAVAALREAGWTFDDNGAVLGIGP